jgi:hypothetical protein
MGFGGGEHDSSISSNNLFGGDGFISLRVKSEDKIRDRDDSIRIL